MGKKAKARRERQEATKPAPAVQLHPQRSSPNWPLLVLAGIGIILAGYLTWTEWRGSLLKGCSVGSSCDIVLSSKWATLFGLPTSLWGLVAYASLAAIAFVKRIDWHWRFAWIVAFFGWAYSVYLTTISLTVLHAACPYCLTSFVLMSSILVLTVVQRPAALPNFSWPGWLGKTIPVAAAGIILLHLNYTGVLGEPPAAEDPMAHALAIYLNQTGAKMYGAYWCPHCMQQKSYFGTSANRLPYVECSPEGQGGPEAEVCKKEGILNYPTWVINGKHIEEVMTLKQLSDASGFQGTP
jgi:uncharacterized membrane protein/glutaredoxin